MDLAARAADAGVLLGLEPVYSGDLLTKGSINSCGHGREIIAPHANAKLTLDLYHSWWDPALPSVLRDSSEQIGLIQLCNLKIEHGRVVRRDTLSKGELDLP